MHSLIWFFTTGIYDPAWVQAVAAVALVVLTLITFVVLCIYAYDTHTLAKTSTEQIDIIRLEMDTKQSRDYHHAIYSLYKVRDNLWSIENSLENFPYTNTEYPPIYLDDWPDIVSTINREIPDAKQYTLALGFAFREIDSTLHDKNLPSPGWIGMPIDKSRGKELVKETIEQLRLLLALLRKPSEARKAGDESPA